MNEVSGSFLASPLEQFPTQLRIWEGPVPGAQPCPPTRPKIKMPGNLSCPGSARLLALDFVTLN